MIKHAFLPVSVSVMSHATTEFLLIALVARAMLRSLVVKCTRASQPITGNLVNVTLSEIDGSTHVWIEKGGT
jgi:hypothetical protein